MSRLAKGSNVVAISRDQLLKRLAHVDAMLDILDHYDEEELFAERRDILEIIGL